jgi:hypothetical protein
MKFALPLLVCLLVCAAARAGDLRRFDTPYYVVHTDLPPEGAAEAVVRMSRLGDELRRRTRDLGFTGRIESRLPFYLYARHEEYVKASGAPPESAGTFDGDRLLAAATDSRGSATWNVVQHEAFHQFAAATTGTELPAWLNEGLGEYFGEALFTGDGYVTGIVPKWRLDRVRRQLADKTFPPLAGLASLSQAQWNEKLSIGRYDHAWSVVQFLLHSDDALAHESLADYVKLLASEKSAEQAGSKVVADADVEAKWKSYWLHLPDGGTPDLEAEAAVATVTSFLARATAAGQSFESFDAFGKAARAGRLRCNQHDWLPPHLLLRALDSPPPDLRFRLEGAGDATRIVTVLPQGRALVGHFTLRDGRVTDVRVARDSR